MRNALARFLLVLALVAQGPVVDLDPGTETEPRLPPSTFILSAWIESPPAADAFVRSDDTDDDDSAELGETGAPCLASRSSGVTAPPPAVKGPPPIPGVLLSSQDSPGASPSRAPPVS